MKITADTKSVRTIREWQSELTGTVGAKTVKWVATVRAEKKNHETKRQIRIVTDTEGVSIRKRERHNENDKEADSRNATEQLHLARQEFEDSAKDQAMDERANNRDRNQAEQERVDPTDSMNTRTDDEQAERVENKKNEIMITMRER